MNNVKSKVSMTLLKTIIISKYLVLCKSDFGLSSLQFMVINIKCMTYKQIWEQEVNLSLRSEIFS